MLNSIPMADKVFDDGCIGKFLNANDPSVLVAMMVIIGNMPQRMLNVGDNVTFLYATEVTGQWIGVSFVKGNVFVWMILIRK